MRVEVPDECVRAIRDALESSPFSEADPRETLAVSGLLNTGLSECQREKALASARWVAGSLTYTLHLDPPANFTTLN